MLESKAAAVGGEGGSWCSAHHGLPLQ